MSIKSAVKIAVLCCSLLLFFVSGSFAALGSKSPLATPPQAAKADCADAAIVLAIYKNLQTDTDLKDQIGHINVSVKNGKVKLNGFAAGPGAVAKAGVLAQKASSCVKGAVLNKLKNRKPVSCPDGQKDCDGTCIDKDADCNLPPKLGD